MAASLSGVSPWIWGPVLLAAAAGWAFTRTPPPNERAALPRSAPRTAPVAPQNLIPLDVLDYPAMAVSPDWRVLAANAPALELFGQRIVGTDLRQTIRHPAVIELVRGCLQGEAPPAREIANLGAADSLFSARVAGLDGPRVLLAFADMTRDRLTERMRADFVANASHELRTPLANIAGFIETCQGPAATDEPARQRFLGIMLNEATRMARLIDDLMSLSRIELDKHVRPDKEMALPPLLHEVEKALAVQMQADGRALLIDIEPGLPEVVADRDQILQVLHNLVSNAVKYGRTGTPVHLRASRTEPLRSEPMLRVSIRDEGPGIAPEQLPRLTERFYRIDTGRSRRMGGTGLGLAIVKHIVERHRGRLEISSRPGEGTEVAFLLPVAAPVPERPSQNRNVGLP